jgi:hypothetical protein
MFFSLDFASGRVYSSINKALERRSQRPSFLSSPTRFSRAFARARSAVREETTMTVRFYANIFSFVIIFSSILALVWTTGLFTWLGFPHR